MLGLISAKILKMTAFKGEDEPFVMEMPKYRLPSVKLIWHTVVSKTMMYLKKAGTFIAGASMLIWFLSNYPHNLSIENDTSLAPNVKAEMMLEQSYLGSIGKFSEPFFEPLGFDWKIGVGLITSFAAREVMVSTLATLYNVEDEGDDFVGITEALKNEVNPLTGLPQYTPLVALSIMVFYVYAAQCMATFAIVKNETNSWKWPLIMIVYMTGLAYIGSLLVYQGGQMLGFT